MTYPNDAAYPWEGEVGLTNRELLALEFAKLIPRGNCGEFSRTARMSLAVEDADALIAALNEEKK